jgi:lysine 2,3-aminomutase
VYDEENGIAIFSSPTVRPGELFYYFDPIDTLSDEAQIRWADERARKQMMADVMQEARG